MNQVMVGAAVEMVAVEALYGWTDLDLGHGFHETKQGIRYTVSEPARREILDRLLSLNHELHEEEVKKGRHEKAKPKSKSAGKRIEKGFGWPVVWGVEARELNYSKSSRSFLLIRGFSRSIIMLDCVALQRLTHPTMLRLFSQSIIETSQRVDFRDLLDWSYNNSVVVGSDYAGEDGKSLYQIYTYTFQTYHTHEKWYEEIKRLKLEKNYKGPPEFKGKRRLDKKRDWLEVSQNKLGGFVISFAVPSVIESLFAPGLTELATILNPNSNLPKCAIKPKEMEKAYRVSFFGAMILSLLLHDHDKFFWQTDNDPIVDGRLRLAFVQGLIGRWLSQLSPGLICPIWSFEPPFIGDNDSRDFSEDLLALSDLTAGSVCEFFNRKREVRHSNDLGDIVRQKAHAIMKFFPRFNMFIYGIDHDEKGYRCANYQFELDE
jgi:hypothetical protein